MDKMDGLDRRLMYELDLDARQSASSLARKLRKSKETVNFRLNRLIKENYLKGFYTVFNSSKLGWFYYKLYLKFKDITPQKERELLSYLRTRKKVAYLASLEGYYDCIVLIAVRSPKEIMDFIFPFMKLYGKFVQTKDATIFLTAHRFNQRFLYAGGIRKDWHYSKELENYEVDELGRKILKLLTNNARMSAVEIADKTNADPKAIAYRMNKLEKDGIILSYVTAPNFDRLGLEFFQVNISFVDPSRIPEVIEYFDSTNSCLFALEMLGRYDLAVELHLKNGDKLKRIINGFREKFVGVYNDYDVSSINEEIVMIQGPFYWQ